MRKLREFPEWSLEKVEEVAEMLYTLNPFKQELWHDELRWKRLARAAYDFLDYLRTACQQVAQDRKVQGEVYARANQRIAEAAKLPAIVPFEKAIRHITNEIRTDRALSKFRKVIDYNARRKRAPMMRPWITGTDIQAEFEKTVSPKLQRSLRAQMAKWKKSGIARDEVLRLQSLFEAEWPLVLAEENRKKARKRRSWQPYP